MPDGRQKSTQACPPGFSEADRRLDLPLSGSVSAKLPFVTTSARPPPVGRPAGRSWPRRAPERQVSGAEIGAVFDLTWPARASAADRIQAAGGLSLPSSSMRTASSYNRSGCKKGRSNSGAQMLSHGLQQLAQRPLGLPELVRGAKIQGCRGVPAVRRTSHQAALPAAAREALRCSSARYRWTKVQPRYRGRTRTTRNVGYRPNRAKATTQAPSPPVPSPPDRHWLASLEAV